MRRAAAFQVAVLSLGLVATGLAAGGQTPGQALRQVATRIHWRIHEKRAMEILQRTMHLHRRHRLSRRQQNKLIAMGMMARHGWKQNREFPCLERLWIRESGWNHRASNGYSGAYGIPQALPGSKMRTAGADWRTNPETQIKWGLRYIKYRYGSPCHAWAHSLATGWY
jgi:hypothetical protein